MRNYRYLFLGLMLGYTFSALFITRTIETDPVFDLTVIGTLAVISVIAWIDQGNHNRED